MYLIVDNDVSTIENWKVVKITLERNIIKCLMSETPVF